MEELTLVGEVSVIAVHMLNNAVGVNPISFAALFVYWLPASFA